MGLGDRVREIEAAKAAQSKCNVNLLAKSMPKKDGIEFMEYVNSPIQASVLSQACEAEGYKISPFTIQRHRRGKCSCKKGQ